LIESIASLRDNAANRLRIEVLVAADPDDNATAEAARQAYAALSVTRTRFGYPMLQKYVNLLTRRAQGQWMLLWNDDARMLTEHWDARIAASDPGVLWPAHNGSPYLNVFPVVHRKVVDLLGHFSLSPHCDSWVQDIAQAAGIHHHVDIEVLHDRFDLTGGHDDQTWREAQAGYRTEDYHSPDMVALRQRDIDILRQRWTA
jgi:hypothetical protein